MDKATKEQEHFRRAIASVLRDFERNREWADIGNWLYKLEEVLKGQTFSQLPERLIIGKRLAQCLNPTLPPGVHGTALRIYEHIFANCTDRIDLYPSFSIGLFNFFEHSISQLKFEVLKIIEKYYVDSVAVLPMLVGLVNAIMPGLNENHEELARRIYAIFGKVDFLLGRRWVDGAVWVNILKSPRTRLACFKYFQKVFKDRDKLGIARKDALELSKVEEKEGLNGGNGSGKGKDTEVEKVKAGMIKDILETKEKDDASTRFPNAPCLVMNALLVCLAEGEMLVQRAALDLMVSYIGLSENVLGQYEKEVLVQACLHLLLKKEYQLTRRIYTFLLGSPDADGTYVVTEETDSYLRIVEKSFYRLLVEEEKQSIECPVLVLEILLKEHEQLISRMLPNIAYNLICYVADFYRKEPKLEKTMHNLLTVLQPKLQLFIDAILAKLDPSSDQQCTSVVKILDFYYSVLAKGNPQFVQTETLQHVLTQILRCIEQVKASIDEMGFVLLSLEFLLRITDEFKVQLNEDEIKVIESLIEATPTQNIYSCLLHLHPNPHHHYLMPYVESGPLSLPALTLLMSSKQDIEEVYLDKVFECLFRLLDCHLWEEQAIELIKKFDKKYHVVFCRDIETCDVGQWLVYWRRLNGDVKGHGVIRMLKFTYDQDPLKRHSSLTWLQQSSHIISKILHPVFRVLGSDTHEQDYIDMYHILRTIITNQEKEFCVFLFSQKEHYINVLLARIFQDIGRQSVREKGESPASSRQRKDSATGPSLNESRMRTESAECASDNTSANSCLLHHRKNVDNAPKNATASPRLKSESIQFLQFVLNSVLPEQKVEWIQLTFLNIISCLQNSIESGEYELEIQLLSYISQATKTMPTLLKWKQTMTELLEADVLLKTVLQGLSSTKISYVKSQYVKLLTEFGEVFTAVLSKKSISALVNTILEKYSMLLKQTDILKLEHLIQGKRLLENKRKMSGEVRARGTSQQLMKASFTNDDRQKESHIENKYSDTTNLWSGLKFYVSYSIAQQIEEFRVDSLLSLILNSFPFSYLSYRQYHPETVREMARVIHEEVKNVSGLKKEVLDIFDALWKRYNRSIMGLIIEKSDPRILVHCNLDPVMVMQSLLDSTAMRTISQYYRNNKLSLPKNYAHYNRDVLQQENRLLYFAYLYVQYTDLHASKNRSKFWDYSFLFVKHMSETTHIQTKLWLLELLDLLFKKVSLKEIGFESRGRAELQEIVKDILGDLSAVITGARDFTHKVEIKSGLRGLFSKEEKEDRSFDFVRIFPPTIYELEAGYQPYRTEINFYVEERIFQNCFDVDESRFKTCLALVTCKTLSSLMVNVVGTSYEGDIVRMVSLIKDFLSTIIEVCKNRDEENQVYIELVSEVLHKMVMSTSKTDILKAMKRSIFEIYMGNDFFKCTKKTLGYWRDIINHTAEMDDILSDLLAKETGLSGLFTGKAESTRLKIKSFERICFIIYAGKVDQYEHKLRSLLESLNDVMKEGETSHPALLILILFCIRVLIIRLSQNVLNKMFKTIWPSLMTLLMQLFEKRKVARNPNLILAGLKVVELVTAMQLEEFNLLKWIFIFDYFGVQVETLPLEQEQRYPDCFLTPFDFEPLLMSLMPKNSYRCTFIPTLQEGENAPYEPPQRKMNIKEPSVDSENELRSHAYMLIQYLLMQNQRRVKPNKAAIESTIEADFISLDDYIFDIK